MNILLLILGILIAVCCISYVIAGAYITAQPNPNPNSTNTNYYYGVPSLSSACLSSIACVVLIVMAFMGVGSATNGPQMVRDMAAQAGNQSGGLHDLISTSSVEFS